MSEVFSFTAGESPLLVSIPHDGRALIRGQAERMTDAGRSIPDTDWHVKRLYEFALDLGVNLLAANYSRYVVDLNRPADDGALYEGQVSTGLCPEKTFAGEPIYGPGQAPSADEHALRIQNYWQPYHDELRSALDAIRGKYGYALLWDAHSIAGQVPLLFEGVLPDLNIGTNDGRSCSEEISSAVLRAAEASSFSRVLNGRFRGGYITRHYGEPGEHVHAIQLELAQRCYMDETSRRFDAARADKLAATVRNMLNAFTEAASEAA